MSESVFLSPDYSRTYTANRKMNSNSLNEYFDNVSERLGPKREVRILDVGCGTGQFTALMAEYFADHGVKASIDGVDKSPEMLRVAQQTCEGLSDVRFIHCDMIDFKSEYPYDLVFSSEMIHLVDDLPAFITAVDRSLAPDGVLAIRTSTHKQLYERQWYRDFPGTLQVDLSRHKSAYQLTAALEYQGLHVDRYEIDESETMNVRDYLHVFENRGYSTLWLIPDRLYEQSLSSLREKLRGRSSVRKDYQMTLYLARKTR